MIAANNGDRLVGRLTPIAAVILALGTSQVDAADKSWLNPVSGSWHNGSLWSGGAIPGASDTAVLANAGTIQLNAPATVDIFGITGTGSLTGSGTLTTNGIGLFGSGGINGPSIMTEALAWWGTSSMTGSGETKVSDTAMLGDGENLSFQTLAGGRKLALIGDTGFLSYRLFIDQATVTNKGTFESLGDIRGNTVFDNAISGTGASSVFNNQGSFIQDATGRTTNVGAVFNNTGSTTVRSGTLKLSGGGTHSGSFVVDAGQMLEFADGTHLLNGGQINNSGVLKVSYGTTTFASTLAYTGGGLVEASGGTLSLNLAAPVSLTELRLTGGTVNANNMVSTPLLNMEGGILNLQGGGTFSPDKILLVGGILNTNGTMIQTPLLDMQNGTLHGTDNAVVTQLNWSLYGTMSGSGTTRVTGQTMLGDGSVVAEMALDQGRTLTLEGPSTYRGRRLLLGGNSKVNNLATFTNRGNVAGGNVYPNEINAGTFNNIGSFVQDASGTGLTISSRFNNSGTVTVSSGTLSLAGGGSHTGSFDILAGQTLEFTYAAYDPNVKSVMSEGNINNQGTLRFGGRSTITFDGSAEIKGAGTIEVADLYGTLNLNAAKPIVASKLDIQSGSLGGTINIGAALQIPVVSIAGGTVNLTGAGPHTVEQLAVRDGTLKANASNISTQGFLMRGGTFEGTGLIEVGNFTWVGGAMQGAGTTEVTGNAQIKWDFGVGYWISMYSGRTLNLRGTTELSTQMQVFSGSQINNFGTLTSRGSVGVGYVHPGWISGDTSSAFNNRGQFIQDASGKDTKFDTRFNNSGQVLITSGALNLRGGGSHAGHFQVQAGQKLELGGGTTEFNPGSGISNLGALRSSGGVTTLKSGMNYNGNGWIESGGNGVLNLDMGGVLNPQKVVLGGGTLNANTTLDTPELTFTRFGEYVSSSLPVLAGTATVYADTLDWPVYGTMSGSGKTVVRGTAMLKDWHQSLDQGRTLVLNGQTTFRSQSLEVSNGSRVVNNGVISSRGNLRYDNSVYDNIITSVNGGLFHNAGSFIQDSASKTTTVETAFRNSGVIQVTSGHMVFKGGFEQTTEAGVPGGDAIASTAISFSVAAGASVAGHSFVIEAGLVDIDGSLNTFADGNGEAGSFVMTGGTLMGSGTINGDAFIGGDASTAVFTPGHSPGMFTINGDVIFGAGSVLELEVGLDGTNNPVWDRLLAHSIRFQAGSTVRLKVANQVGELQDLDFLSCSSGCVFEEGMNVQIVGRTGNVVMSDAGLSASVAAVPEPETWALLLAGTGLIGMRLRRKALSERQITG